MFRYKPGDSVGPLEHWPLTNPASDYRIVKGDPRTFGRIDKGGPGHTTRYGIWRCTPGAFECIEQGDELMMVLSGRCRLTWVDEDRSEDLEPGDSLMILDGSRVRWDVQDDLTKVFFAHKADGY